MTDIPEHIVERVAAMTDKNRTAYLDWCASKNHAPTDILWDAWRAGQERAEESMAAFGSPAEILGWPTYSELEDELERIAGLMERVLDGDDSAIAKARLILGVKP